MNQFFNKTNIARITQMEYIFPIAEIEQEIISHSDLLSDLKQLSQVSKYYFGVVSNNKTYIALKHFYFSKLIISFQVKKLKKEEINFILACQYNHLFVAKYLWRKYNQKLNIHADHELAFRYACQYGYLETAKWLYNLGKKINSPVDIHAWNEYAFRQSCKNGHLKIAKWLYFLPTKSINILPIDIHNTNNWAFRYACENHHLKVTKWLCILDNKYHININPITNKIEYIID